MEITVADDLTVRMGRARVRLTPSQGLSLAETLVRASFRRARDEEFGAVREAALSAAESHRTR